MKLKDVLVRSLKTFIFFIGIISFSAYAKSFEENKADELEKRLKNCISVTIDDARESIEECTSKYKNNRDTLLKCVVQKVAEYKRLNKNALQCVTEQMSLFKQKLVVANDRLTKSKALNPLYCKAAVTKKTAKLGFEKYEEITGKDGVCSSREQQNFTENYREEMKKIILDNIAKGNLEDYVLFSMPKQNKGGKTRVISEIKEDPFDIKAFGFLVENDLNVTDSDKFDDFLEKIIYLGAQPYPDEESGRIYFVKKDQLKKIVKRK